MWVHHYFVAKFCWRFSLLLHFYFSLCWCVVFCKGKKEKTTKHKTIARQSEWKEHTFRNNNTAQITGSHEQPNHPAHVKRCKDRANKRKTHAKYIPNTMQMHNESKSVTFKSMIRAPALPLLTICIDLLPIGFTKQFSDVRSPLWKFLVRRHDNGEKRNHAKTATVSKCQCQCLCAALKSLNWVKAEIASKVRRRKNQIEIASHTYRTSDVLRMAHTKIKLRDSNNFDAHSHDAAWINVGWFTFLMRLEWVFYPPPLNPCKIT